MDLHLRQVTLQEHPIRMMKLLLFMKLLKSMGCHMLSRPINTCGRQLQTLMVLHVIILRIQVKRLLCLCVCVCVRAHVSEMDVHTQALSKLKSFFYTCLLLLVVVRHLCPA
jgi:hypothetical protein